MPALAQEAKALWPLALQATCLGTAESGKAEEAKDIRYGKLRNRIGEL